MVLVDSDHSQIRPYAPAAAHVVGTGPSVISLPSRRRGCSSYTPVSSLSSAPRDSNNILIIRHRRTGTNKITVAMDVIDAAHWWPEFLLT